MKKRIITFALTLLLLMSFVLPVSAASFRDLSPRDWYYNEVQAMVGQSVLSGYPDGTFRGENPVTLAEFVTILFRILDMPYGEATGHWAGKQINECIKQNWIAETDLEKCGRDEPLSRELAAKLLVKILKIRNNGSSKNLPFHDAHMISNSYRSFVATAYEHGLIKGDDAGNFNPQGTITRGAAATLAWRGTNLESLEAGIKESTEQAEQAAQTAKQQRFASAVKKFGKQTIIDHFLTSALYAEEKGELKISSLTKWNEPIKYYISGTCPDRTKRAIEDLISSLNQVGGFPGFVASRYRDDATLLIDFLPHDEMEYYTQKNYGAYRSKDVIVNSNVRRGNYILTGKLTFDADSVTANEVCQSIFMSCGLLNNKQSGNKTSLLHQAAPTAKASDLDLIVLELLYDVDMLCRFNEKDCTRVLNQLLPN